MKQMFFLLIILFSCKDYGNPIGTEEDNITYTYLEDIQPIFTLSCITCHGNSNPAGGLNLLSYKDFMPSSAVVPGNHRKSELYDRIIRNESEDGDMPPVGNLSEEHIEFIQRWIDDGALK